jgi:hypothetical protein
VDFNTQFQLFDYPESDLYSFFFAGATGQSTVVFRDTVDDNTTIATASNTLSLPVSLGLQITNSHPNLYLDLVMYND